LSDIIRPLKDVFLYLGISGFMSVFQAAGCGLGLAAYLHFRDEYRKRRPRASDIPSFVFGGLFIGLWAVTPTWAAFTHAGWLAGLGQTIVLSMIIAFIVRSCRLGVEWKHAGRKAEEQAEEERPLVLDAKKHFFRALPGSILCFYLSAAYIAALLERPFPHMPEDWLESLVHIEFLVIHSLPFLSLITLIRFEHKHWRFFQWYLFVTWYCLYLGFALELREHWDALAAFAAATFSTYLGFMLEEVKLKRIPQVFKRWGVCFAVLVMVCMIMDARDWRAGAGLIPAGALYFAIIGIIELTPLYQTHWRNWMRDHWLKREQPVS